jgi:hypothetical protein
MILEDVFLEKVTVVPKHIASRNLAAPALPGPGIRVDPAATTTPAAAVIGSHDEQRRGRGRAGDRYRDIASVSRRGPALLRFRAMRAPLRPGAGAPHP